MSIIEKAAQRLEQLRQAGVVVPSVTAGPDAEASPATAVSERPVSPAPPVSSEGTTQSRHSIRLTDVPPTPTAAIIPARWFPSRSRRPCPT